MSMISNLSLPHSISADSPEDYIAVDTVLTFGANDAESCVGVIIRNDSIQEHTEMFSVILERTPDLDDRVTLNNTEGIMSIIDDDGGSKIKHVMCGMVRSYIKTVREDVFIV